MSKKNKPFPVNTLLFLIDTTEFNNETLGAYVRLLFTQWENRSLPCDLVSLAKISSCSIDEFEIIIWPNIKHKFVYHSEGRIHNEKTTETKEEHDRSIYNKSVAGSIGQETKKRKKKELTEITYPWNTITFIEKWTLWKKHKKDAFRFAYRTTLSEQLSLNSLAKLVDNEVHAIELIMYAIEKGWQGIYIPHNYKFKNGLTTKEGNQQRTYDAQALNELNRTIKNNT